MIQLDQSFPPGFNKAFKLKVFNKTAGTLLVAIKFSFCNSTGFHTSVFGIEQTFQGKFYI